MHYKNLFLNIRADGTQLETVKVWTDNCGGQYKCRQNFIKIANSPGSSRGVNLDHSFAQKYGFKGPWDSAGKGLKYWRAQQELKSVRLGTVWEVFKAYKEKIDKERAVSPFGLWKYLESKKNPKILEKTPFNHDLRYVCYVTDNSTEFTARHQEYPGHVVYANRELKPEMDVIPKTHTLFSVKSDTTRHDPGNPLKKGLVIADFPCSCLPCRGKAEGGKTCEFEGLRNKREHWAIEKDGNARPSHLLDTDEEEERLLKKMRKYGFAKAIVTNLKKYLELGGEKQLKGPRKQLEQRALEMKEPPLLAGNQLPLAAVHMVTTDEDDQLSDVEDEENVVLRGM